MDQSKNVNAHDSELLKKARLLIDNCSSYKEIGNKIQHLVSKNDEWRGKQCLNLVAAEAPTSSAARQLLASEVGIRASGGHIGTHNRCFAAMDFIDEIESLCVELLKILLGSQYADHRLLGGMHACQVAYTALTNPSDTIMSLSPYSGGDSSNRVDGAPGVRGLRVIDIPFDLDDLEVDLDAFSDIANKYKPRVVGLGLTTTLFPLPIKEIKSIISAWGGVLYFDGAHQAGLIAGKQFPNPLLDGADILTGSSGKTFSGPQGGIIAWNDEALSSFVTDTIFPTTTGSHQINRVASLALTATELLTYGEKYMQQVISNAQALAYALEQKGFHVLCSHKGYTKTHQIMVDTSPFGGGFKTACTLSDANIVVNKMLLPIDSDEHTKYPSGIRIGTVEVTRLGMFESDMETIASFIHKLLINKKPTMNIKKQVVDFRERFQDLYYCYENGYPPTR